MDSPSPSSSLAESQASRLQRFGVSQSVDIHCHCIPGVDDGPETIEDAVNLCRALVRDGITTVIATPHQLGRYEGRNSPAEVRTAIAKLNAVLVEQNVPLKVMPGGDVRVDHRLNSLLDADGICSLADTKRYLLLELPHETFIELRHLVAAFTEEGRTLIVSHPERHGALCKRPDAVIPWLEEGAVLQVTGGSLLGKFGPSAETAAWNWLEQGLVHIIATDAHNVTSRPPTMSQAIDEIAARLGEAVAKRICLENPLRVLLGEPLLAAERRTPRRWMR